MNSLKHRGSSPKVPQKYRKYWRAYLKNKSVRGSGESSSKSSGSGRTGK
ncbi:MAG: hypothetical protein NXI31_17255 [bacterium]|nr:hypothetical protein [bacterium]